ncbi:MAG: HNH endonuclease [Sulfurimonas sp.]|jgi:5-methylcytosine-specific restriction protein A|uniref:HNH endonuclease n=1 Tax=Sulfurimonas sp. TaxID=2022749 RepID=UPI0035623939
MENNQRVVIQPIGARHTVERFLQENTEGWSESLKHEKDWLLSKNAIVLFVKDKKIFAKATISEIKKSTEIKYPLEYSYNNLEEINNIDFNKIFEYSQQTRFSYFDKYELFDERNSQSILNYLSSLEELYISEIEADLELQNNFDKINSSEPEEKPQTAKSSREYNGKKYFPRNLSFSKKALEKANYLCEVDKKHTTFTSKSSQHQFAEAHHLIPLRVQNEFLYSLDVPANIISLCPMCHRKIHHGNDAEVNEIIENLLNQRKNKLNIFGIKVSLDDLHVIYAI